MTKKLISSIIAAVFSVALTGCVTQEYGSDATPVVKNQANRDDMAATRISLGLGYLRMGNMAQAKQNLEKAKKFAPNMVQVYTAFAHYYETVGEDELTISSYEKALSLKSDDADTLNNYGVYLCRQDQTEEAEKQLLKAISVPTYILVSKSYENLSSCFLQKDNFEKAEVYLHKAIMHSPGNSSVLFQMVRLQYAMGKYTLAKTYEQRFEKATRRFTPQSLALAFKVYWQLGQHRTAKNYGSMLVKMYPQSWEAQQYLLNELELIEADNLAKRYKLTQMKDVVTKPKKRVVKLSPKKPSSNNTESKLKDVESTILDINTLLPSNIPALSTTNSAAKLSSITTATSMAINDALTKEASTEIVPVVDTTSAKETLEVTPVVDGALTTESLEVTPVAESALTTESVEVATVVGGALVTKSTEVAPVVEEALVTKSVEVAPVVESVLTTESVEVAPVVGGALVTKSVEAAPVVEGALTTKSVDSVTASDVKTMNVNAASINPSDTNKRVVVLKAPPVETNELTKALNVDDEINTDVGNSLKSQTKADEVVLAEQNIPLEDREIFHVAKKPVEIVEDEPKVEDPIMIASTTLVKTTGASKKQPVIHVVTSGDTLFGISIKYNIKIKALRRWNKLTGKKKIRINDELHLIDPKAVTE